MAKYVISSNDRAEVVIFQPCLLEKPGINIVGLHAMDQVFNFGVVTFTVWDDVAIRIMRAAPETVGVLGVNVTDVHGVGSCIWVYGSDDG